MADSPSTKTPDEAADAAGGDTASTAGGNTLDPVAPAGGNAVSDDTVVTRHTLTTPGGDLAYTATVGRVVLREEVIEDGTFVGVRPRAEVSLTAYTLDGADPLTRPITFAFNGGPGSASVWLHLGLLGPRRVVSGDAGALARPPYGLVDNPESLLTVSDLVFVDPVSTGWSRAVEGGKPASYHGYEGDIASVGEVIRAWVTSHGRWMSPKLLAGESYGTIRAAALADHLQAKLGLYLNGVVLISSVLDLSSVDFENQRNDRAHALYLPTYAAIAHHHGKHEGRTLREVLDEAEAYAARDYPWALSRGDRLSASERTEVVRTIARLAGLSETYVSQSDLRIEHLHFFAELLRDRGLVVGRIDGRFTAPTDDGVAEKVESDPSIDATTGAYTAAFNHYVHTELGYSTDLAYAVLTDTVHPWSFKDFEGRPIDVSPRLEAAMRRNPHLLVHVAYGWYDGATPHFAAEDVFAKLRLTAADHERIEHRYYEAGHMMYVHEPSRLQQSADLADFVRRACSP